MISPELKASQKILSLKSYLFYNEKKLVRDGDVKPVIDSLRKRTRRRVYYIYTTFLFLPIFYAYFIMENEHALSIYEYVNMLILLSLLIYSWSKLQKIKSVIREAEEIIGFKNNLL